jgi:hypothetical protein
LIREDRSARTFLQHISEGNTRLTRKRAKRLKAAAV